MNEKLLKKISSGILIFDGAMGTELYKRHFFVNTSFDQLCLTAPHIIKEIHQSYVDAGAEVLTTNTFGANRARLVKYGLNDQLKKINIAAATLAREVIGPDGLVAGDVAPVSELVMDHEKPMPEAVSILSEQVEALIQGGVDFILFETFATLFGIDSALEVMQKLPPFPYLLSMTLDRNAETVKGEPFALILEHIHKHANQPVALGINCGEGPEGMLSALEKMLPMTHFPIIVQPNAGMPKKVDGRLIYMASPEYFATYGIRYANLGAAGVGGCCGTTPEHILELARAVKPLTRSYVQGHLTATVTENIKEFEPIPMQEKSKLGAKLAKGEWVTSIEMTPPRGFDLTSTIQKAIQCKDAGIDALNLPDGPRASSRLSPIVTAIEIQEKAGIEPVLHVCCRDKNLIGMQTDLLGCAAKKINNILFITGDPPKLGDYPFASAVFDVDSIGMVKIQNRLNRGIDIGGKSIEAPMSTLIGVGTDPNALDLPREIRRLKEKIESGAEFIITQPVFDPDALMKFLDMAQPTIPVIAGIWPLASLRNAEFMKNEVPGVVVPDFVIEQMAQAQTKDEQRMTGIAIARDAIARIRHCVQGVQVSAPFGNVDTAIMVIKD